MTKLEQLIKELCPDGVEYKTIGDIAIDIYRGSGIKRDQVTSDGIPCVRYGEIYTTYNLWFDECVSHTKTEYVQSPKYFDHGDILFAITGESVEEIAKSIAYTGHEKGLAGGDIVVLKHKQNPKYLSYVLSTQRSLRQKSAGKVKAKVVHSSVPDIKSIIIPLPPLEIQSEIVRILDRFTMELSKELVNELNSRKKQYDYYSKVLLSFSEETKHKKLRELVNFRNGKGHEKIISTDGKYVVINSKYISTNGKVKKYSNNQICPLFIDDILMVMSDLPNGKALAKCFLVDKDDTFTLNQRIGAFHIKTNDIITRFLFYVLNRNSQLLRYDNGVDQTNLRKDDILDISIPVPPIVEQQKIVDILDRLDKLCNDITKGIPAEIEARQKQYEYYRDKLLTFKELKQ